MKQKMNEKIARQVAKILEKALIVEANSNSCVWAYEPQKPEGLERYKIAEIKND